MAGFGFRINCLETSDREDAEFAARNAERLANGDDELTREQFDALQEAEFWAGLTQEEAFELIYPDLWAEGCRPVVAQAADPIGDRFRAEADRPSPTEPEDEPKATPATDAPDEGEAPASGAAAEPDPEPKPQPNVGDMLLHLDLLADPARDGFSHALIEIAWSDGADGGPRKAKLFGLDELDAAATFAAKMNAHGCNVYVGATLKKPETLRSKRTRNDDFLVGTAIPIDIDDDAEAVINRLDGIGLQVGVTVTTGRTPGLRQQRWHLLAAPCTDGEKFKRVFERLVEGVRADRSATGLNRLMRLAGSVSYPSQDKVSRGYIIEQTTLEIDANAAPLDIDALIARIEAMQPEPDPERARERRGTGERPKYDGRQPCGPRERACAAKALADEAKKLAAMGPGQRRNAALNDAALAMGHHAGAGRISRVEVYDALLDACRRNGWLAQDGQHAFDATFRSGFEAGLSEPAGPLKDRSRNGGQSAEATEKLIDGLRRRAEEARANADDAGAIHHGADDSEDAGGPEKLSAAWWRRLQLPPRDYLLGDVICTTSRWHLVGETGVGKTLFGLDMAAAIAAGSSFLGWEGRRRCRVMYLDGEMPAETFQERMIVVTDRYGEDIELFGYSRDVLGQDAMPPLNTDAGMCWLWDEIQRIKPDIIFFDSIMCLLEGNMSEEDSWNPIKPYIRFLTNQRIAQVWIDHTGHDATRAFGTKTKQWEMDTVAMLSKLTGEEFDDSAAAMQFEFAKKRLCTPSNYKQFQPKIITGGENGLVHKDGQGSSKKVSNLDVIKRQIVVVYDRLALDVEWSAGHAGEEVKKVAIDDIRERLKSTGYLDTNDKGQITSSDRQQFRKAKMALLTNGGFTEKDGMLWRFKNV